MNNTTDLNDYMLRVMMKVARTVDISRSTNTDASVNKKRISNLFHIYFSHVEHFVEIILVFLCSLKGSQKILKTLSYI